MKIRIEFNKNDKNDDCFHVYKKDSFLEPWEYSAKFKSLNEAIEWSMDLDEKVDFTGVYENGKRIKKK